MVSSTLQKKKLEGSVPFLPLDVFLSRWDAWSGGSPLVTMRGASLGSKLNTEKLRKSGCDEADISAVKLPDL